MNISSYISYGFAILIGVIFTGCVIGFFTKIIVCAIFEAKRHYKDKYRKEEKDGQ